MPLRKFSQQRSPRDGNDAIGSDMKLGEYQCGAVESGDYPVPSHTSRSPKHRIHLVRGDPRIRRQHVRIRVNGD